jgi:hypothetical protein
MASWNLFFRNEKFTPFNRMRETTGIKTDSAVGRGRRILPFMSTSQNQLSAFGEKPEIPELAEISGTSAALV